MPALDSPLVCPVLVGRDGETAVLEALQVRVERGEGRVVLVSGEAGIGKSRLLQSIASSARERGWRVISASCYEQDRGLPLAAVIDLVQRLIAADPEGARALLEPAAAPLARLLPELRERLGAPEAPEALDPEQEQRRLFSGMVAAFERATERDACIVLLEDLHWADRASLDFVASLARRVPPLRLLVLASYRSDEAAPALGPLLAYLDRERLAAELPLRRLTLSEVDTMVRACLSQTVSLRADILQSLYRRTDGNPFHVEEMLRSVLADPASDGDIAAVRIGEAQVPRSISEAVMRRVARVTADARELLTLAAVIGDRFELPVLEAVCDIPAFDLLALLRELATHQLLVEVDDDQFRFRHALTREAVLRQLLARERRSLHARIADAIEVLHSDDLDGQTADLAYHLFEAQLWERAAPYAQTAGQRAMRMYAPATAVEQFSRAIEAARRLDQPVAADLHLERARAYDLLGDFDSTRADLEAAIREAEAGGEGRLLVDALLELGLLWASRDYRRARGHFDRAVEVARALDEPPVLARALNRLGNWYSNAGRYTESRGYLDESLDVVRELGDARAIAETVDLLGMTCLQGGRLDESLTFLREAVELFGSLEDRHSVASPLSSIPVLSGTYQTSMLRPALTLHEATVYAEAGLTAARQSGGQSAISYSLWQLGFCLGPQGEYARALDAAAEALAIAERIEHQQWAVGSRCVLGAIYVDLLQGDRAVSYLEQAVTHAEELGAHIWSAQATDLLTSALLLQGRADEAAGLISRSAAIDVDPPDSTLGLLMLRMAEAELAFARSQPDRAIALLEEPFPGQAGVRAERLRGRALLALDRSEDGIASLRRALEMAQANGDVSLQWRLHADLAHALLTAGDRTRARTHAGEGLALIEGIATELPDADLGESFRERAVLLLPPSLRPRGSRGEGAPLSARELDVARLVARGLTNRAIADHLVVSIRTVESHVANAMAKLGHTSRSQLAAWVVEHGLLTEEA